jgi:glutaconate CoA-transferase subunit B
VRLPGGGGAPEIATHCAQVYVVMPQTRRSFVERVDFVTSFGHGEGGGHRQRLGIRTLGPTLVVTDLCLMRPDPETKELVVVSIHAGVTREQIGENTGWPVRFAEEVAQTPPPGESELMVLRDLQTRTARAHGLEAERND